MLVGDLCMGMYFSGRPLGMYFSGRPLGMYFSRRPPGMYYCIHIVETSGCVR